jgi:hypothetical protein
MAANKIVQFAPVALTTTTTTNIWNPGTTTGGTGMPATSTNLYFLIRFIRIVNKLATTAQAALWLGATGGNAAGTEWVFPGVASAGALTRGVVIPAQSYIERGGLWRVNVADFVVGGTDTATALTIEAEGEVGIV